MASATEVEERLRELLTRLEASDPQIGESLRQSVPDPRMLSLHLPDLEAHYWAELDGGRMRDLRTGARDDADVRITVESDDLIEILDGRSSLFPAYLTGKIRIEASFDDILLLRKLLR